MDRIHFLPETCVAARFPTVGKICQPGRLVGVIQELPRLRLRGTARDSATSMWGGPRRARFDELVALHTPALTVVARKCCRESFSAKDLLQETLLRAWLRFDSLQDDSRARAWLVQIMRNIWLDQLRRRRNEVSIDDTAEPAAATADEPSRWEGVTLDDLHRAIEQLEEPFRSVAVLHDVDGLSYRDITARLAIPYSTAATRLHRAHQKIKQLVLGKLDNEEDS